MTFKKTINIIKVTSAEYMLLRMQGDIIKSEGFSTDSHAHVTCFHLNERMLHNIDVFHASE